MAVVDISIACRDLPPALTGYLCKFSVVQTGSRTFIENGCTEVVYGSLHPQFERKFQQKYAFEECQCISDQQTIGSVEVTLGQIMGAGARLSVPLLPSSSTLLLTVNEVMKEDAAVRIQFRAQSLHCKSLTTTNTMRTYLNVMRELVNGKRNLLHRTNVAVDGVNPIWKPFHLSLLMLNTIGGSTPITIECWECNRSGSDRLIGECSTTVDHLKQGVGAINLYKLKNPTKLDSKRYKDSGLLELVEFERDVTYSFYDYIRSGESTINIFMLMPSLFRIEIHFTVAVDFSVSNGNPLDPKSLHYIHPHQPNQYMIVLESIASIIENYNTSRMFAALGFGAKIPPDYKTVSHEFFLNFHPNNPHCYGVDGLLDAYRRTLMCVQPYGPTNFAPVLYHVSKFAQATARHGKHYFVLLIITDGMVTDIDKSIDAIVALSQLPMSVVIVGVGDNDLSEKYKIFDGTYLKSSSGQLAERCNVQYFSYGQVQQSVIDSESLRSELAKRVLAGIPEQLTEWMNRHRKLATPASTIAPISSKLNSSYPPAPLLTPYRPPSSINAPHSS